MKQRDPEERGGVSAQLRRLVQKEEEERQLVRHEVQSQEIAQSRAETTDDRNTPSPSSPKVTRLSIRRQSRLASAASTFAKVGVVMADTTPP